VEGIDCVAFNLLSWKHTRVFENRALGKVFGPKRDNLTAE
jgi:hypothetical protein